jgi:hypothetical protein
MELPEHKEASTWSSTLLQEMGRLFCGVKGHTLVVCFEPEKMCLECVACGYRSPGWDVSLHARRVETMPLTEMSQGIDVPPALLGHHGHAA